jgi:hypothetical protein
VVEAPAVEAPRPVEVARGSHEWPRQRRCIDGWHRRRSTVEGRVTSWALTVKGGAGVWLAGSRGPRNLGWFGIVNDGATGGAAS